jgi:hypothetical protein
MRAIRLHMPAQRQAPCDPLVGQQEPQLEARDRAYVLGASA